MEENNENNMNSGLNEDTFGAYKDTKPENGGTEQQKTVYTPEWNAGTYSQGIQPNYYTGAAVPVQGQGRSRALEICALVFGILGIVGCCCYGVFGLVGLVLSIIALATGKKSGLSIAALVCSLVGVLLTVSLIVYTYSDAGREARQEFMQAFNEAYEEQYGVTFDEALDGDGTETAVDAENGSGETEEFSDGENSSGDNIPNGMETVILDGKEIKLPCKFADIKEGLEISDYNKEDMEKPLEAYDSLTLYLAVSGEENGVRLRLWNNTDNTMNSLDQAQVNGIKADAYFEGNDADISFFQNITLGMDVKTLEEKLEGIEYEVDRDEDYTIYFIGYDLENDYEFSIMTDNERVVSIDLDYYGDN